MSKAYRTLISWLIWGSAAVVIYLSLYIDTDVLSFFQTDQSRVTWIISVIFLIGIVTSFFLTIAITREFIEAEHQDKLAQVKGLAGVEPTGRKKRAVNRFYDSLKIMALSNESPDVESLIAAEFSFYSRLSSGIEVLSNLLITLGLIGTVVGLTLTMTGLTGSLDALGSDQEMLIAGLRKAMGGMGTAFYTTLLGAVLGGVLLRIFALITDNGIGSLHDTIMKTCIVHCSADFRNSPEKDIRFLNVEIEALADRVKTLQMAFQDSRTAINEFRDAVKDVYKLSGDETGVYTLRESLRMQKYYRALIKQELQMMNKMNYSWWQRFKGYLAKRGD